MRVLVTSTPGSGHIHPLVPLVTELQDAGHDVVWATAPEARARVERYGFRSVGAGLNTTERRNVFLQTRPDVFTLPPRERRAVLMPGLFGRAAAPPMRADLEPIVEEYRPDIIVHEVAEFAGPLLANLRGTPHVAVGFSGALTDEIHSLIRESVAGLWATDGLTVPEATWLYDDLYLHPFPAALGPGPPAPTTQRMRPLNFDGATLTETPEWTAALGRDRPLVYATFGTDPLAPAPWTDILAALALTDADAVATLGVVEKSSVGPIPANVRVEAYVPQAFLLERAAVVVSHGGAGTILGAAVHGIPQLCVPLAADQWANADAVAASGAGITLELDQREPAMIHGALRRLVDEPEFGRTAQQLAADFRALPHPREFVSVVEGLA
jgi:UDP:flavonoid glycosyltransferase YjiC (YdhE family)